MNFYINALQEMLKLRKHRPRKKREIVWTDEERFEKQQKGRVRARRASLFNKDKHG